MIKANELRIGSKLNYITSEGETLATTLDWQDLKWISEDEKGFNIVHSPIPLTEEILLKCGAVKHDECIHYSRFKMRWEHAYKFWNIVDSHSNASMTKIEYVHEWQNFIFIMDGKELKIEL